MSPDSVASGMVAPEQPQRAPENEEELLARLEYINQDENPIERALILLLIP